MYVFMYVSMASVPLLSLWDDGLEREADGHYTRLTVRALWRSLEVIPCRGQGNPTGPPFEPLAACAHDAQPSHRLEGWTRRWARDHRVTCDSMISVLCY